MPPVVQHSGEEGEYGLIYDADGWGACGTTDWSADVDDVLHHMVFQDASGELIIECGQGHARCGAVEKV